jgi:aryl-alcohol dehydrogenase-like predicted oxidoreductase
MMTGTGQRADRADMIAVIRAAVEKGVTLFDTAEFYGRRANEELAAEEGRDIDEAASHLKVVGHRHSEAGQNMTNR